MKVAKILMLLAFCGTLGCITTPQIPPITSAHPASAEGTEGRVEVAAIPLIDTSTKKNDSKESKNKHEMGSMNGMVGMKMGDK